MIQLYINDLRQTFRDRMMIMFLFLPLIMVAVMRILYPLTVSFFPVMAEYGYLSLALLAGAAAIGPGFLVGFLMLNEKEEGIFEALRILPISAGKFVLYRMGFITMLGFVACLITLSFSGLKMEPLAILVLSVQIALYGPITTLLAVTFAKNKIEGVTLLKGLNFFFAFPLVIIIIDPFWELAAGIFPYYWTYLAFEEKMLNLEFWAYLGIGFAMEIACLWVVFRVFRRRIF